RTQIGEALDWPPNAVGHNDLARRSYRAKHLRHLTGKRLLVQFDAPSLAGAPIESYIRSGLLVRIGRAYNFRRLPLCDIQKGIVLPFQESGNVGIGQML